MESAPADMLAWSVVKRVREELSCHTRDVICAIDEMKYVIDINMRIYIYIYIYITNKL